eukprot:93719-Hanusia_phi.AAC.6
MRDVLEIGRGAIRVLEDGTMPRAQCTLHEGDMYKSMQLCSDADLIFVYATCFATTDGVTVRKLSNALAPHVKPEARVITVNKRLSEVGKFHAAVGDADVAGAGRRLRARADLPGPQPRQRDEPSCCLRVEEEGSFSMSVRLGGLR